MIVTGLSFPTCGRSNCTPSTPAKISSNNNCGGASFQFCEIPSRNAASPQHTRDGEQSFIIVTNSPGACREYRGTTISPSAMSARSMATQRMLFAASNPHRSPFCRPLEAINVLALRTNSSNSPPVTLVTCPSRISARIRVSAAVRSSEKISPTNGMSVLTIWIAGPRSRRTPRILVGSRHQLPQPLAHRRQIILPTPFSPARLKLRIPSLHFLFKIHTHARHHLQIPYHSFRNPVGDGLTFTTQLLQSRQQLPLKLRIVHRHQQILMASLPH